MTKQYFKKLTLLPAALLLTLTLLLGGCSSLPSDSRPFGTATGKEPAAPIDGLAVHFIDVGQGDSILAESKGHFMLIDAGENDQGDRVISYLKEAGVEELDYVIGTHPHSDHIGGLDDVIDAFPVKKVILPPIEHTTKTFEDVLDSIASRDLKLTRPVPGDTYPLGEASFSILGPGADYGDDLNNWSVGLRLSLGDRSFVMCGDAEEKAEKDMAESGLKLSADVLKAGHHGSSTSTSDAFLKKISPSYAVIQCGEGNSYGHPHKEILDIFKKEGIQVFRTDEQGTISAYTDGTKLIWTTDSGTTGSTSGNETGNTSPASKPHPATNYILNENTKKFHLSDCSSVKQIQPENRRTFSGERDELIDQGYNPCGQCKP